MLHFVDEVIFGAFIKFYSKLNPKLLRKTGLKMEPPPSYDVASSDKKVDVKVFDAFSKVVWLY